MCIRTHPSAKAHSLPPSHPPSLHALLPSQASTSPSHTLRSKLLRHLVIHPLQTHRPLLHHQTHHLEQGIRRRHSRQLSIRIIRRCHLDNIRRHEIHPLQPAQDGAQLARRPPARFGGSRRGRKGRVEGVDVDAEVDGVGGADTVADLLDDACRADGVDGAGFDDLEAAVAVVGVVGGAGEGGADARVDVGVIGEEALFVGVVEVGAVVDGGLVGWGAAEDFGAPGVEVGVEVDDGDGAVGARDGAEEGESDGVVAAKGDEAGEGFAGLGVPRQVGVGGWGARQEIVVALFNLPQCVGVVVGGDGYIATVEDSGPAVERIRIEGYIVAAVEIESTRTLPDA